MLDGPPRDLYPPIEPFHRFELKVSDLHTIHVQEAGRRNGQPVLFLHGGPGGGIQPDYRRFFHPDRYRVILVDQRGCGRSSPFAELRENTTQHLIQDMEAVRENLRIDRWFLFGGSWGSTLALAYAQAHPDRVRGILLRGIFLGRKDEIAWFYQSGANRLFPDAWDDFLAPIPEDERHDLVNAYYRRLTSEDAKVREEAAAAWSIWEGRTGRLVVDEERARAYGRPGFAAAFARIECHYFANGCFLEEDDQLLKNINRIRHIPAAIVHGRYDVVCPLKNAWDLKRAWPEAELLIAPTSGHSMFEDEIRKLLVELTDRFSIMK